LAQYVLDVFRSARVAVIHTDDQFGKEGSAAFIEELGKGGTKPIAVLSHKTSEADSNQWAAELATHDPDLVVIYTYLKPAADLLLAAKEINFRPDWLGSYVLSGPDLFRFAGKQAAHGLRATSYPYGPRYNRAERLYCNLMSRNYADETPGTHSRIGYAAAQLVSEGLKRAGPDLTREAFITGMESIQDWSGGLLPPISYGADDHRGLTALAIVRALHGRWLVEQGLLRLKE
jgi:branched-chain amino acid transport system substrate-binding protein